MSVKILVFAGSMRQGSVNKKLARFAAKTARNRGAEAILIDLAEYRTPVYDGDMETQDGLPDTIRKFKDMLDMHDAMIIATPEYNGHVPPVLINLFAWVSRPEQNSPARSAFGGKKAAIISASPGKLGGVRVIPRLRDVLAELGVVVIPGYVSVPGAFDAFDEGGALKSEQYQPMLQDIIDRLIAAI